MEIVLTIGGFMLYVFVGALIAGVIDLLIDWGFEDDVSIIGFALFWPAILLIIIPISVAIWVIEKIRRR